jgi:hypothetical protein
MELVDLRYLSVAVETGMSFAGSTVAAAANDLQTLLSTEIASVVITRSRRLSGGIRGRP